MKKCKAVVLSMLVLLGLMVSNVMAADSDKLDFYIGAKIGMISPDQGVTKPGAGGGIEVGIAKKFFGFAMETDYFSTDLKHSPGYSTGRRFAIMPFMFSPFLQLPLKDIANIPLTLKVKGGPAYVVVTDPIENTPSGGQTTIDFKSTWGFHYGFGADYQLNDSFSVGADATYLFLKPDYNTGGTKTYSIEMNQWILLASLKYHFNL